MSQNSRKFKVVVPATTSNLGPAFDCLGLALQLYNELTVEVEDKPGSFEVEIEGYGAGSLPRDESNLVVKAMKALIGGRVLPGRLRLSCVNRIPLARGLGSSAAAALAGVFAANELLEEGARLTRQQLLEYAATIEGHPDNVAPAVFGGLVASVKQSGSWLTYALKTHKDLRAAVCVPAFELSTAKARSVLPDTYLRTDAVDSVGRACLLAPALEHGRWDVLPVAMEDRLHQPYRAPLIKGFNAVLRAAREAGCGAALSGAGPSILALGAPDKLEAAGKAMVSAFEKNGVSASCMILPVDAKGVVVTAVKAA